MDSGHSTCHQGIHRPFVPFISADSTVTSWFRDLQRTVDFLAEVGQLADFLAEVGQLGHFLAEVGQLADFLAEVGHLADFL